MAKDQFWWAPTTQARHDLVTATMRGLEKQHTSRLHEYWVFLNQYSSQPQQGAAGVGPTPFNYGRYTNPPTRRIRYNLIRTVIDVLVSLAATDKPRPVVLTENGTASRARQAGYLAKYFLGVLTQNKAYDLGPVVFRDAALFGLGVLKVGTNRSGNLVIERVYPGELFFDLVDAYRGAPRSAHHRWWISRAVALKNFPGQAAQIKQAPAYADKVRGRVPQTHEDFIQVVESWHLPSYPGSDDGLHTICLETATLVSEPWKHDMFPFATLRWGDPVTGYEAEGIGSQLAGHQIAINNHLANMEEALNKFTVPRVWIDSASNVTIESLDNRIGAVLKYDGAGKAPIFETPHALEAAWVEQTRWYISSAFEMVGINLGLVDGRPPPGVESGTAMREFADQAAARWRYYQQKYENLFVDLSRIIFMMAKDQYDNGNDIGINVKGRSFIEKINFSDVNIQDDMFELSVMPTSMLPKAPGARFATLDEYFAKGYISREEVLEQAEVPDLQRATSLAAATLEHIDITIDKMLFDKIPESDYPDSLREAMAAADSDTEREQIEASYYYIPPVAMQNLESASKRMVQAWNKYYYTDIPLARVELLSRWVQDAKEIMTPPQPMPGTEGMPGMANQPEGPPVSGLGLVSTNNELSQAASGMSPPAMPPMPGR